MRVWAKGVKGLCLEAVGEMVRGPGVRVWSGCEGSTLHQWLSGVMT